MSFKPLPRCPDGTPLPPLNPFTTNTTKRLNDIHDLSTRDDDILVGTYPKSGTHWIHEILSKLLYNDDDARLHRKEESTFLELMPDLSELESLSSPQILYTHLPVHYLPERHMTKGGKTIHVIRDPRDVVVSAFHHFLKEPVFKDYFKRVWEDHLSDFMSGNFIYGDWFKYELEWEMVSKSNNVLVLVYEEMKTDEEKAVRRIAEFLGIPCSKESAANIALQCSISVVKERKKSEKNAHIYRKGEVGDWKNHFTVTQAEQFNQLLDEKAKDSRLKACLYFNVLKSSLY